VGSFERRSSGLGQLGYAGRSSYRAIRTVLDWLCAIPLLIICVPLLVVVAAAIRVDSEGPAFFRQQRIGKAGRPFTMVKFRTMRLEAPASSLKVEEDSQVITRMGRILRRSGLDELPQLWNVVRGEMAMIGPRPEQADLIELYEPWQHQRHLVRPGITGWWQIHHRDGQPLHLNVDKDLFYIQHQGPRIDALIVIGTLKILVAGVTGAFRSRRERPAQAAFADAAVQEGDNP
jgi:lipopolysaccharide/colanic/teichoic acid biosynthesis glycosyltransferase